MTPVLRDDNPYVLLGLPFGASSEAANVAFARKARPLKRQGDAGHEALVRLTRALNDIVEGLREPDLAIDLYRVPADPTAFEGQGGGVLAPGPELLERRQPASDPALADLRLAASFEVLRAAIVGSAQQVTLPDY